MLPNKSISFFDHSILSVSKYDVKYFTSILSNFKLSNIFFLILTRQFVYSKNTSKWAYLLNQGWKVSVALPAVITVITLKKNNNILISYKGPNPFIYHLVFINKNSLRVTSAGKERTFKIQTAWQSLQKNNVIKTGTNYNGAIRRDFND